MARSRTLVLAGIAAAVMIAAPSLAPAASAQTANASSGSVVVPFILWAATGAVIGTVAWPLIVSGTAASAASAAPAGIMSLAAFLNTGAAAGAVVGGVGYLLAR